MRETTDRRICRAELPLHVNDMPSKSILEPAGKLERVIEESDAICTLLPLRILPSGSRLALKDYRESWLLAFLRAENSISRVILSMLRIAPCR